MNRILQKILVGMFAFAMFVTSVGTYLGDEGNRTVDYIDEGRVVRVGFYHMSGFQYYDEDAKLHGYCIDYLETLASFTGWEYEFVPIENFSDGCEKLKDHSIDLLAPAMETEARKENFAYSELNFGTEYTILVANKDREDLYYEDYENFGNLKIAVLKDYPLTEYFLSYMKIHEFEPELVYYDSINESKAALEAGEVDAIVTSIMDMEVNQKLLARFSPQPFYFLTWKGNTELLSPLNKAMSQVQNTYPTFLDDLLVSHYPIYKIQFYSREEMEFVRDSGTLRVAYIADRKPLSFTNDAGEFDGISRELFDKIAELSGLKFEYVALPEGNITYEFLQEQKIDLVTGVENNDLNKNANGILLSTPYISARKMIVSQKDFVYDRSANYKIAIPAGSKIPGRFLSMLYPNMEIVECKNNEACYEALAKREVDMLLQNQYVAAGVLSKPRYNNFVIAPMEGLADELCFSTIVSINGGNGMSETDSVCLITIINKTISQLEEQDVENIIVRETLQNQYELDLLDLVYGYGWLITSMVIAFIFMILFFISLAGFRRIRKGQKAKEARLKDLQQKRYKTIIDCSDDLIYEINLDGDFNISSEKIKEKFGWEIPQKLDTKTLDFAKVMRILHVHPEDEKVFQQATLTKGERASYECTVRLEKGDGSYIWCKVFCALLTDDNKNVVSFLGKIKDVDEETRERKVLEENLKSDPLTGLLNKPTFKFEIKKYLENNSAQGVGFVFMDMDHFKEINDKLGHRTGDAVIKETAKKIQLLFANFDLVSRFGGDEFCIFVRDIPRTTFEDRLKFAVEKMQADYPYDEGVIHLSASIGASYCKRDKVEYRELLETADKALYKVKNRGKNGFQIDDIE